MAYTPSGNTQIFGGFGIPLNRGYDALATQNFGTADQHDASGYLKSYSLSGQTINLWITEVTADFSVSGQRGQSQMRRDFYPRSFNDVTLTITGNVPNTQEYNRLAMFIRESQWTALNHIARGDTTDQTIEFGLYNNTPSAWIEPLPGKNTLGKRPATVRGPHRDWQVKGYIPSVQAGAVAHNTAPEFTIQFVVTDSPYSDASPNTNLWSEVAIPPSSDHLRSMLQLLNAADNEAAGAGFVKNPTPRGNRKNTFDQGSQPRVPSVWSLTAASRAFTG